MSINPNTREEALRAIKRAWEAHDDDGVVRLTMREAKVIHDALASPTTAPRVEEHIAYRQGLEAGHRSEAALQAAAPVQGAVDDAADAALWRKHKNSFAVLTAMLDAASPLVLNKLKAQEAERDSTPPTGGTA